MSIKLRHLYILVLLFSCFALGFAYFVEYVMTLAACPLCIYQRFPYLIFITLCIMSISGQKNLQIYYILTVILGIILAAYHTGVERQLFQMSSFCKPLISSTDAMSVADFTKMLYHQQIGMCNKPALVIFGFSMTEWNLFANLGLFVFFTLCFAIDWKNKKRNSAY